MTPGARLVITYNDGTTCTVVATLGDLTRMSQKFGAGWNKAVEDDPLPYATYLAWLASRHGDQPQPRDFDGFLDDLAALELPPAEVEALAPFPVEVQNGSRSSWPSPPAPTPDAGSTSTPVSP